MNGARWLTAKTCTTLTRPTFFPTSPRNTRSTSGRSLGSTPGRKPNRGFGSYLSWPWSDSPVSSRKRNGLSFITLDATDSLLTRKVNTFTLTGVFPCRKTQEENKYLSSRPLREFLCANQDEIRRGSQANARGLLSETPILEASRN